MRSLFASGSVHARLQVSVYSGYDLCHHGCPKIDLYFLTPVTLKSRSNPTLIYIHVRCTHDANLVTAGSQVPEILHISIFVITYTPMKVGQGDLLFCVRSVFSRGSSHARLQVSVYSSFDLCHPIFPKFYLSILIRLTSKSRSSSRDLLHPCQVHPRSKFGDRRSASCRDNADMSILMTT